MAVWHAKPRYGYTRTSQGAKDNAEMFYGVMNSLGWSLEAVAAALGNQAGESEYNPWRWGSDNILATDSPWIDQREYDSQGNLINHAYGLFQQDPAGKYLHRQYAMSLPTFAPNYSNQVGQPHDGDAQCRYLHWICSNSSGGEWLPSASATYGMSYSDFYTNAQSKSVAFLTRTFFHCYERGTWSDTRITGAEYWYEYLGGVTPPEPPEPPTPTGRKLPLIFYLRYPF